MKTSMIILMALTTSATTTLSQAPPYDDGRTQPAPVVSSKPAAQSEVQQQQTLGKLLSYKQIIGAKVKNNYGQELGSVENLVIDVHQGRIVLAILSIGEVLGVGGKRVPVPFTALSLSGVEDELMLDAQQGKLQTAPGVESEAVTDATYRDWAAWSYSYFGETPYWGDEGKTGVSPTPTPAMSPAATPAPSPAHEL